MAIDAGTVRVSFVADISGAISSFRTVNEQLGNTINSIRGKTTEFANSINLIGTAVAGVGFSTFFTQAAEYDKAMVAIRAVNKETEESFRSTRVQILELAKSLNIVATDAARAFNDVVQAGFSLSEAFFIVEASLKGARAGLTTAGVASTALIQVLNAFKLPASESADVMGKLIKAVDLGVFSFEKLATNIGVVSPLAKVLGVSLNETLALMTSLTRTEANLEEVTTQIRSAFTDLLAPGAQARATIEGILGTTIEAAIANRGFTQTLGLLIEGSNGSSAALARMFPNVRAMSAIAKIAASGIGELNKDIDKLATSGAANLNRTLEISNTSLASLAQRLKATVVNSFLEFFEKNRDAIASAGLALDQFLKQNKDILVPIAGFAAGLTVLSLSITAIKILLAPVNALMGLFVASTRALGGALETVASGQLVGFIAKLQQYAATLSALVPLTVAQAAAATTNAAAVTAEAAAQTVNATATTASTAAKAANAAATNAQTINNLTFLASILANIRAVQAHTQAMLTQSAVQQGQNLLTSRAGQIITQTAQGWDVVTGSARAAGTATAATAATVGRTGGILRSLFPTFAAFGASIASFATALRAAPFATLAGGLSGLASGATAAGGALLTASRTALLAAAPFAILAAKIALVAAVAYGAFEAGKAFSRALGAQTAEEEKQAETLTKLNDKYEEYIRITTQGRRAAAFDKAKSDAEEYRAKLDELAEAARKAAAGNLEAAERVKELQAELLKMKGEDALATVRKRIEEINKLMREAIAAQKSAGVAPTANEKTPGNFVGNVGLTLSTTQDIETARKLAEEYEKLKGVVEDITNSNQAAARAQEELTSATAKTNLAVAEADKVLTQYQTDIDKLTSAIDEASLSSTDKALRELDKKSEEVVDLQRILDARIQTILAASEGGKNLTPGQRATLDQLQQDFDKLQRSIEQLNTQRDKVINDSVEKTRDTNQKIIDDNERTQIEIFRKNEKYREADYAEADFNYKRRIAAIKAEKDTDAATKAEQIRLAKELYDAERRLADEAEQKRQDNSDAGRAARKAAEDAKDKAQKAAEASIIRQALNQAILNGDVLEEVRLREMLVDKLKEAGLEQDAQLEKDKQAVKNARDRISLLRQELDDKRRAGGNASDAASLSRKAQSDLIGSSDVDTFRGAARSRFGQLGNEQQVKEFTEAATTALKAEYAALEKQRQEAIRRGDKEEAEKVAKIQREVAEKYRILLEEQKRIIDAIKRDLNSGQKPGQSPVPAPGTTGGTSGAPAPANAPTPAPAGQPQPASSAPTKDTAATKPYVPYEVERRNRFKNKTQPIIEQPPGRNRPPEVPTEPTTPSTPAETLGPPVPGTSEKPLGPPIPGTPETTGEQPPGEDKGVTEATKTLTELEKSVSVLGATIEQLTGAIIGNGNNMLTTFTAVNDKLSETIDMVNKHSEALNTVRKNIENKRIEGQ